MRYLLVFTILIFSGCSEYELINKSNKTADDFVALMAETNEVVKTDSGNIKENTQILLEIKESVNKLVEHKQGTVSKEVVSSVREVVQSPECDCQVDGICDCIDCQCNKCENGICPVPLVSTKKESAVKNEIKTNHVWGSAVSDYYVIKYGERWCGGCNTWDRIEEPKILQGCKVKHRFLSEWPNENINVIPDCKLFVYNGIEWEFIQTFPSTKESIPRAADINAKIKAEIQKRSGNTVSELRQYGQSNEVTTNATAQVIYSNSPIRYESGDNVSRVKFAGRLSEQSIRNWIISNGYNPRNCTENADVRPRSNVWNHLTDNEHGFLYSQVKNLPQWMALALHNASHMNQITPYG